ncbi:hypothetical protein AWZ03_007934 [Drosophila navojoa]|uniref:DAGKc domain-containing protein n=1 Tax=Drosophila navojoa TaxID=7232 RepID=A0A484BAE7_DRONA|nr:hypothetical protein AWZ03_007934 [Drosophila navojoa]
MNTLKLIRNNWKKSLFLSCVVGYGASTIKSKLDIKLYMNKLSNEVLHSNQATNVLPKNVLVIMNPIAKKKKAENLFKKYCEPLLHLAGFSVEILRTSHIGHAKTYVEEMNTLPDVIVVAGGDGTKSEVVTGLLRRQGEICPISLLPLGREKTSGFNFFNFGSELEFVKSLYHVWQVVVQQKGISVSVGMTGNYHCCLTSKSLTFECFGNEVDRIYKVEILLNTIRRCGHASPQNIFFMELGRQSVLGAGELWMETEDAAVAKHMHDKILSAMSAKTESNMNLLNVEKGVSDLSSEPMRKRSSSANEASKPINVLQKRQNPIETRSSFSPQYNSYGRERCDSLPTRSRTLSECSNHTYVALKNAQRCNTISGTRSYLIQRNIDSPISYSMKCSESEGSSISIDDAYDKSVHDAYRINSITSKAMIPEENIDDDFLDSNKVSRITGLNNLLNVVDRDSKMDFTDHMSQILIHDGDIDNHHL